MAFLVYDDAFLEHDTGPRHPERPERLTRILARVTESGLFSRFRLVTPRKATDEELERVHPPAQIRKIREACEAGQALDPDTVVGPFSFRAALLAAGAAVAGADEIGGENERRGFCLVRPPGHHAGAERAMGFCLFNNIAVAVRHLQVRYGVGRMAIVDFDVHHGNGTEQIFRDDEDVFYLSTHRHPFYPGTGGPAPAGRPPRATLDLPLPSNTSATRFVEVLEGGLEEVRAFRPEVVLVSAGFDAEKDDPIGGLGLTAPDFRTITDFIVEVAEETAQGRVLSFLEGGYNLDQLGACVENHLLALEES